MSMLDTDAMPAALEAWLAEHVAPATVDSYSIMTGGFSRVMAQVDLTWAEGGSERFVLRGDPPPELATLDSDRDAEWSLLRALSDIDEIPTPAARWFIDDTSLFGTKAILIDWIEGGSLQAAFDSGLDQSGAIAPFVDLMSAVGSVEPQRVPLPTPASWDDHMESLIGRWRAVADRHGESLPIVRYIAGWLARRKPAPAPLRLVHGDFQQGNIVDTATGWQMVDWEFARVGDPREDLGYYAAYSAAVPPSLLDLDMDTFLARFRERSGLTEEQVNPVTLGYFTVLSTIGTLDSLYDGLDGMIRGERQGVAVAYNSQLIPVGNDNFVNAIDGLEAALAAAEG